MHLIRQMKIKKVVVIRYAVNKQVAKYLFKNLRNIKNIISIKTEAVMRD